MANPVRRNGAYAPLGANYYLDDAIIEAGEKAEVLYCRGLAFCASTNSDGYITDAQVIRIAIGLTGIPQRIKRLVDAGLWERIHGGYQVRAWLKWNRSAQEIGRQKAKDRERKAAAGAQDSERNDHDFQQDSARNVPQDSADSGRNGEPFQTDSEPSRVEARARHTAQQLHDTAQHVSGAAVALRDEPTEDPTDALLAEHVRAYAQPPPPSAIIPVKREIMRLVSEKVAPDRIRDGLTRLRERRLAASLLPQLVVEAGTTRRRSTSDDRAAAGLELAEQLRAEGR